MGKEWDVRERSFTYLPNMNYCILYFDNRQVKHLITLLSLFLFCSRSQEQSNIVIELLHQYTYLKMTLNTVVESALSVAHNLPDHNHNAQEAKRTFERVSAFDISLSSFVEYNATTFCLSLLYVQHYSL